MTGLKESKGSPFSSRKLRNLDEVEEQKLVDDVVSKNTKLSSSSLSATASPDRASLKEPPEGVDTATALSSPPLLTATDDETACQKTTATTTTTTTKARVLSSSAAASTESSWPCANCHAMVSEERCPHCRGIQVKINKENRGNRISSKVINKPELWVERLSPATVLRKSPRPASITQEGRLLKSDNDDNKLIEIEDAEEELDASSTSPKHDIEDEDDGSRPIDPVAYTLASAPSPFSASSSAGGASTVSAGGVPAVVQPLKRRGTSSSSGTAPGLEGGEPKKQRMESAT